MKTICIFSFTLTARKRTQRWKLISLRPSSESVRHRTNWTLDIRVSAIKLQGPANNLRGSGAGGKWGAVLRYFLKIILCQAFRYVAICYSAVGIWHSFPQKCSTQRPCKGDVRDEVSSTQNHVWDVAAAHKHLPPPPHCPPLSLLVWNPLRETGITCTAIPTSKPLVFLHFWPDISSAFM